MIKRELTQEIIKSLTQYPIISLTGPRQSGKSTLLTTILPDYKYVSLESPEDRKFALDDPRGFLEKYNDKTIIDEAQYAPDLFSYIQMVTDFSGKTGQYVLSGSQNFLLLKSIKQSLAGRVNILKLLPFSYHELSRSDINPNIDELIFMGGYPRIYDKNLPPSKFYENYLQTYIDRDVDDLLNVREISTFNKFLKICATRIGQILDITSLANDCGIDRKTASSWLSILESSYIAFQMPPYFANIGKRLIKSPKLYFYDTGLACYLLGIKDKDLLVNSRSFGSLFENFVIGEMLKGYLNADQNPDLYFWRDNHKNEVDIIDATGSELKSYEVKSSKTMNWDYLSNLSDVSEALKISMENRAVIYNGETSKGTKGNNFVNWREIG